MRESKLTLRDDNPQERTLLIDTSFMVRSTLTYDFELLLFRPLLLRPAFQRDLALELLAGDLAADQPGEGPDGCIGARGIASARFRSYDLDADPVAFGRHRLRKSHARKGQGPSKNRPRLKEKPCVAAVRHMGYRRV